MNTQPQAWTEARIATLKELHAIGLSAGQIAARMGGVSRNAVLGKIHRISINNGHEVTRNYKPWTNQMVKLAAQKWAEGMIASEIGELVGKSGDQVTHFAAENRDKFPSRRKGRMAKPTFSRSILPEAIDPQFLVPAEGYDAERMGKGKELYELEAKECHWPLNHGGPFLFCAAEAEIGETYCVHHRLRAMPKVAA